MYWATATVMTAKAMEKSACLRMIMLPMVAGQAGSVTSIVDAFAT
jgi:hypothetical protein